MHFEIIKAVYQTQILIFDKLTSQLIIEIRIQQI